MKTTSPYADWAAKRSPITRFLFFIFGYNINNAEYCELHRTTHGNTS
jgi:hypothetical protein